MKILFPLPSTDFDPTESAIPWQVLVAAGHEVVFATPDARPARADHRVLTGEGFAIWQTFLRAGTHAQQVYAEMAASPSFQAPLDYDLLFARDFDGVVLTGGHAPPMKAYLEAPALHQLVAEMMESGKAVGAICHGVLVVARAMSPTTGRSVLAGRKTTALTTAQEMSAYALTGLWLGSYYRTYAQTVQQEVTAALASPADFLTGPFQLTREGPGKPDLGFTVRDGNYLSARYYGDAYKFAQEYLQMLGEQAARG